MRVCKGKQGIIKCWPKDHEDATKNPAVSDNYKSRLPIPLTHKPL